MRTSSYLVSPRLDLFMMLKCLQLRLRCGQRIGLLLGFSFLRVLQRLQPSGCIIVSFRPGLLLTSFSLPIRWIRIRRWCETARGRSIHLWCWVLTSWWGNYCITHCFLLPCEIGPMRGEFGHKKPPMRVVRSVGKL